MEISLTNIRPQWTHPYLEVQWQTQQNLSFDQLENFAYGYYLKFLPFFQDQPEGSLQAGVTIELSRRLKRKLGTADLLKRLIALNHNYFKDTPHLLPYTLFHEMTHIWLYDCNRDPNHTHKFYEKMREFERSGLPVDHKVHIHTRPSQERRIIYTCPECSYKWFLNKKMRKGTVCDTCRATLIQVQ